MLLVIRVSTCKYRDRPENIPIGRHAAGNKNTDPRLAARGCPAPETNLHIVLVGLIDENCRKKRKVG